MCQKVYLVHRTRTESGAESIGVVCSSADFDEGIVRVIEELDRLLNERFTSPDFPNVEYALVEDPNHLDDATWE